VAVKVIKNQTAYYRQALVEVSILTMVNELWESLPITEVCNDGICMWCNSICCFAAESEAFS